MVSDIREMATSGSDPINFRIEDSQIAMWCDQIRSKLAAQDIAKRKSISTVLLQTIPCQTLIQVDRSECCNISTGCKVLRTENQLPRTI
jgi:hypothetical protein